MRYKLEIRKPICIKVNVYPLKKMDNLSGKYIDSDELIWVVGNNYTYDRNGNPYGEGVCRSHDTMMLYIFRMTNLK